MIYQSFFTETQTASHAAYVASGENKTDAAKYDNCIHPPMFPGIPMTRVLIPWLVKFKFQIESIMECLTLYMVVATIESFVYIFNL